ncbi:MAG: cyclic-di-AMP receptor [Anaerolineales bacterium]|nr:cyclic-di-AMP receptor [Anaerolineales bacterium]
MKLMMAILNKKDCEPVIQALVEDDFRVTRVASTGGFLRQGNVTLLIGTDEEKVERALEVIRTNTEDSSTHAQTRATVFVLDVAQFEQL